MDMTRLEDLSIDRERLAGQGRILVVDDEYSIRYTFGLFLDEAGYRSTAVSEPDEALRALSAEPIDLAFVDILLENTSGIDLMRQIKERSPSTEVVIVTGAPSVETASEALRLGAFDYLVKPVGQEELLRITDLALRHKAVHDAVERYRLNLEAIFRSIEDGVVTVDERFEVVEVNRAAERLCGLRRDDVVGKPAGEEMLACDAGCLRALRASVSGGPPVVVHSLECHSRTRPDQVVSVKATPLLRGDDVPSGGVLVIRDQTRLESLEQTLRRVQPGELVGASPAIRRIRSTIESLAELPTTVLITGEAGVGKEVVAEALHATGRRRPLLKVSCAALPRELLESGSSATSRAPSSAPTEIGRGGSSSPGAAACCSTRSTPCRSGRRSGCCGSWRRWRSGGWGTSGRSRSTCGCSPRPTGPWRTGWPRACSGRICSVASRSSRSASHRFASVSRTSRRWSTTCSERSAPGWASGRAGSPTRSWSSSFAIRGRATCASSRPSWSTPWCSPVTRRSGWRICRRSLRCAAELETVPGESIQPGDRRAQVAPWLGERQALEAAERLVGQAGGDQVALAQVEALDRLGQPEPPLLQEAGDVLVAQAPDDRLAHELHQRVAEPPQVAEVDRSVGVLVHVAEQPAAARAGRPVDGRGDPVDRRLRQVHQQPLGDDEARHVRPPPFAGGDDRVQGSLLGQVGGDEVEIGRGVAEGVDRLALRPLAGRVVELDEEHLGELAGEAQAEGVHAGAGHQHLGRSVRQGDARLVVDEALPETDVEEVAAGAQPLHPVGEPAVPALPEQLDVAGLERAGRGQQALGDVDDTRSEERGEAWVLGEEELDLGHLDGGPAGAVSAHDVSESRFGRAESTSDRARAETAAPPPAPARWMTRRAGAGRGFRRAVSAHARERVGAPSQQWAVRGT